MVILDLYSKGAGQGSLPLQGSRGTPKDKDKDKDSEQPAQQEPEHRDGSLPAKLLPLVTVFAPGMVQTVIGRHPACWQRGL